MNIVITDDSPNGRVALPVDREQLGGFIAGLLGQQQSIERELLGTFNIDHAWLLHVHALLEQRIHQQNGATLSAFGASIYYSDDLKRDLTSIEAFRHFSETKNIRSVGVKLTWTYLINFPGKQVPERQVITLLVAEEAPTSSRTESSVRKITSSRNRLGLINYRIHHTERTWADDIETLLRQEIDLILQKETKLQELGAMLFAILSLVFIFGGLVFPEIMNDIIRERQIAKLFANFPAALALKSTSIPDIGIKMDLLLGMLNPANALSKIGLGYRALSATFGIAMGMWCMYLTERRKPCFVVLTRSAEDRRRKLLAKGEKSTILLILSFLTSIAAGVIANYVYLYLTT